jgi:NAD(P) transhydrogenase subunit alpha
MPTDGQHHFTSPGGRGRERCASKRERVRGYALGRSANPPPHPEAISRSLPTSPQRGEVKEFPLRGGVRGGGKPDRKRSGVPPSLTLLHKGGGDASRLLRAIGLAALLALLPTAAFAAAEGIGGAVDPSIYRLMVFVMAIFVGYYVVWSVTPALHTPLMSVTNAISSVIVVGALLAVGLELVAEGTTLARIFGFLALVMASVNIFGGFLVTQRMLAMYKKKDKAGK